MKNHQSFLGFLTLLSIFALCSGCTPVPLKSPGKVAYWANRADAPFVELASTLTGLEVEVLPRTQNWNILLQNPTPPDMILTDISQEIKKAWAEDLLLDLTPFKDRLTQRDSYWSGLSYSQLQNRYPYFLPATVYLWELIWKTSTLDDLKISPPSSLEDLEAAFETIRSRGKIPLAMGTSFGWPALGLLAALDLRFNGAEAYDLLINGKRNFDDPSLKPVYELLAKWRDKGWIDPTSGTHNWPEALQKVRDGDAVFIFFGSTAYNRLGASEGYRSVSLPRGSQSRYSGELGVIQGWVLSTKSTAPEAALNWADQYLAQRTPGILTDSFRISSIRPPKEAVEESAVKDRQSKRLAEGVTVSPQLDRMLPAQTSYDANQAMIRFFGPGSQITPQQLAETLGRIGRARLEKQ